jgi:hypothetical protein
VKNKILLFANRGLLVVFLAFILVGLLAFGQFLMVLRNAQLL